MSEVLEKISNGPFLVSESGVSLGGVDPLGIRQINFDLMDLALPGLNNTARHVRPFLIIAWAWHRARSLALESGETEFHIELLQNFVARVEVIFVLSQMLSNRDVDLPGKQVLSEQLLDEKYRFLGKSWKDQVEKRQYSTALSAPIFYGPGLKSLGWLRPSLEKRSVMMCTPHCSTAIVEFEDSLKFLSKHRAFTELGPVTVSRKKAQRWAKKWALQNVGVSEAKFMLEALAGIYAPESRRRTFRLISEVIQREDSVEPEVIRKAMCRYAEFQEQEELKSSAKLWRKVQVRQVFRLSLEMMLYWITVVLQDGPKTTVQLAKLFCGYCDINEPNVVDMTFFDFDDEYDQCPVELLRDMQELARSEPISELPPLLLSAFKFVIASAPQRAELFERNDRLPLKIAADELNTWTHYTPITIIKKIMDKWVFAQHIRSAVGRGLSDARANGKTILRMRVVLEESGWQLVPGFTKPFVPNPTPDRLDTAVSLLLECKNALDNNSKSIIA